tara:strand:- start:312940 stop:313776 length:837 start_codon:yes stop_codon:yes gene_type:complete
MHKKPRKVEMLFNYNTLKVILDTSTRSIKVFLNRPEDNNRLNIEMLFELEGLASWLTSHLEVNSVVISSETDEFCSGFDLNELKIMSDEKRYKYLARFQRVIQSYKALPQTIICDLRNGASSMGIELALAADIRLINKKGQLNFNFLKEAWVPMCGGISLLAELVGKSNAWQWVLSSKKVEADRLINSGFVLDYSDSCDELMKTISEQSPVARIQAKRAFYDTVHKQFDESIHFDTACAQASMKTDDWRLENEDSEEFTAARDFSTNVKTNYTNTPHM